MSDGSKKTDELGAQISDLKKQQQDLLRDKKIAGTASQRSKKKQRLTRRTRMLSDNDLLDIMRMRAAHSSKEKVDDDKTAKASQAESPGAAATLGTHLAAGEEPAAEASEGNAEQLPDSPA